VGLIAQVLETHGIPTVCVVMNREITEHVKTPRALWVHFPYGAPLGPAGGTATQQAVIRAALALLSSATRPGALVEADVEWPE